VFIYISFFILVAIIIIITTIIVIIIIIDYYYHYFCGDNVNYELAFIHPERQLLFVNPVW